MKTYAAFVQNSILKMLKTGSSVFAKVANFAILKLLLAVVLVLAKVGCTKHAQMRVKHLRANAAIDTSMCLTLAFAVTLLL